ASRDGLGLSEEELTELVNELKESENDLRGERQGLEERLRRMICERLQVKGVEG
ncbi:unnamed protein product, partial [marine sediment metagenome]